MRLPIALPASSSPPARPPGRPCSPAPTGIALGAVLLALGSVAVVASGCGSDAPPVMPPGSDRPDAGGAGGQTGSPDGGIITADAAPPPSGPEVQATACPVFSPIALTGAQTRAWQPSIIWTGTNYLATWGGAPVGSATTAGDIQGALLNVDGTRAAGTSDLVLADTPNHATSPEVITLPDGGHALVFEDCIGADATGACAGGSAVFALMLAANGTPKGPPVMLAAPAIVQRRPYVAAAHGQIYVTFRDVVPAVPPAPARTIARLGRIDATGAPVGEPVILDPQSDGHYPHLAIGPGGVAMVYQRNKPNAEIVLALFDPALALKKEVVLRTGLLADATNPVVQWNTSRWVVAWEDQRDGEDRIYATVVDADGGHVGPPGCAGAACAPQAAYSANGNWPAIASGDLMTSLIGFYGYPGQHIFLARMEASGRLKPGQVVLGVGKYPAVVYNKDAPGGGEYAVVYEDVAQGRVMFARFKCAD